MSLAKDFFYMSVGYTKQTFENFSKYIEKLVTEEKITKEEGKNMLDEYAAKANEMTQKFDEKMEAFVKNSCEKVNFATKDELSAAKEKLKRIEEKIDRLFEKKQ